MVKWARGAYLSAGDLWLCLLCDEAARTGPLREYTHIAFSIGASDFESFSELIVSKGVQVWKENTSEGDSLYILDPDGHKLELHAGDLQSRIEDIKSKPYDRVRFF